MKQFVKFRNLLFVTSLIFLFSACAQKPETIQEYGKPALYWYNQMITQISGGYLEEADNTYISLESEHRNSPLLPTALLILANAHMDNEEYKLANFYFDEYLKRYALSKNIDYVRFLKIKANFKGFVYDLRNQKLLEDTIAEIDTFKESFPKSSYMPLVDTMSSRLYMAKASLDKEIADLYRKLGKEEAAKYYDEKVKNSWVETDEIEDVDTPFYRYPFEKNLF